MAGELCRHWRAGWRCGFRACGYSRKRCGERHNVHGVTDVEIAERAEAGIIVRQDNQQDAKQGIGGAMRQTSTKVSNMNKYRTRVVSTANKVNLQYEEAAADLTSGLTRSISGLF
jgi:hypothetical protein